jgi:hypothetical protein
MSHFCPEQGIELEEEAGGGWQKSGSWVPLLDLDWTPPSACHSYPKGGMEQGLGITALDPEHPASGGGYS